MDYNTKRVAMVIVMACFIHEVVSQKPFLTPQTSLIPEGENLTLTCSGSAEHSYNRIRWIRSGTTVADVDPTSCGFKRTNKTLYKYGCPTASSFTLTILNITRGYHNSTWECVLTDESGVGPDSNTTRLFVITVESQKPVLKSQTSLLQEGENLTLTCIAPSGYTYIQFVWKSNDTSISSGFDNLAKCNKTDAYINRNYEYGCTSDTVFTFTILDITRVDHYTTWNCKLKTKNGTWLISNGIRIFVFVVESQDPVLTPKTSLSSEGANLTITCTGSSFYVYTAISWTRTDGWGSWTRSDYVASLCTGVPKTVHRYTTMYTLWCQNDSFKLTIHDITRQDHNTTLDCGLRFDSRWFRSNTIGIFVLIVESTETVLFLTPTAPFRHEGAALTLKCTVPSSYTYVQFIWERNDEIINHDKSVVIECQTGGTIANRYEYRCPIDTVFTMKVLKVNRIDHYTTWSCRLKTNSNRWLISNEIRILVFVPPQVPVISNTSTTSSGKVVIWGKENRTMGLHCTSKGGYPQQAVNWYMGTVTGSPLESESNATLTSDGTFTVWSNYTFTPTQADNGRTYICQSTSTSNKTQPSNASIELQLAVPPQKPEIIDATTNTTTYGILWGQQDSELTLVCVSRDGLPQQTVLWYNDTITDTPLNTTESVTDKNGLFTVWSSYTFTPTQSDNGTTYLCQSSSNITFMEPSNTTMELLIEVPPKYPPEILHTNTTGAGIEGVALTLECVSRGGYPQQNVAWYKENIAGSALTSNVSVSEVGGIFTVWSNYTFTPTQPDNGTSYVCQSTSGRNTTKAMATVNIRLVVENEVIDNNRDDDAVTEPLNIGVVGGSVGGGVVGLVLVVFLVVLVRRAYNAEGGGLPEITGYRTRYIRRGMDPANIDAMVAKVTEELEEMAEPGTSQVPRNDAIYLHPFLDDNYAVIEDHPRTVEVKIEASSQQLAAAAAAQGPDEPEPPDIEYLHPIPRSDDGDITRSGDYDPGDPKYLPMDGAKHTDRAGNDVPNTNNAEYLPMDAVQDRSRDTNDGKAPQMDTAATSNRPGGTTKDMEHQAYVNAAAADILSEERLQDKQSTGVYRNLATARSDNDDITSTDHEYKNTSSEVSAKPRHTQATGNGSKTVYMDMTNPSLDNDSQNTPSGGSKPSKSKPELTRSTGHGDKTEYMDMGATSPGHEYRNSPLEDTAKLRLTQTKEIKTEYMHMSSTRTLPDHEYGNTRSESQAKPKHRSGRSTEHRPEFVDISIQRPSKDQAKAEYVDMTTHAGTVDIDVLDSVSMSQQSRQAEYVEMKRNSKYKEELEQSRKAEYVEMKRQSRDKDKLETGATRQRAAGEIRSQQSGQAEYVEMKRQSKDKDKLESVATIKTGASKDTSKQSGAESQQSGATLRQKSGISFSSNETIAEYQNLRQQSSNKNLEPDTEDTSL